jgi:hypothetical protein
MGSAADKPCRAGLKNTISTPRLDELGHGDPAQHPPLIYITDSHEIPIDLYC